MAGLTCRRDVYPQAYSREVCGAASSGIVYESRFLLMLSRIDRHARYNDDEPCHRVWGEMLAPKESTGGDSGYIYKLEFPLSRPSYTRCLGDPLSLWDRFFSCRQQGRDLELQQVGLLQQCGPCAFLNLVLVLSNKKSKKLSYSLLTSDIKTLLRRSLRQLPILGQRLVRWLSCALRAVPGSCGASSEDHPMRDMNRLHAVG